MTPLKILLISPYISPTYGGTSKSVADLAHALGKSGLDLDLVTTNADTTTYLDVPLYTWLERETYRIQYFSCVRKNDFIMSSSLIKWLFFNVKNYDLVHTHTIFSPLISACHWICQYRGIPYITTPHGMLEPWAMGYKKWKKTIYYRLVERSNLNRARAIHSIARGEAQHIANRCPNTSIHVIPNGITWSDFCSLMPAGDFYQIYPHLAHRRIILFLGRIDPKKGLDLLASAFALVHQQFLDTHLVIAGPDSIGFLPTARQYFAETHCLQAVTFTGMLTGHLKYAALAASEVYVAPSYSEGFSMSVLEGMASGLPCVMTVGCNFPEAAEHGVAHVVDTNSDAVATALIACLSDPKGAKEMGDRARQFIQARYTWDTIATQLISTYQASVASHPN